MKNIYTFDIYTVSIIDFKIDWGSLSLKKLCSKAFDKKKPNLVLQMAESDARLASPFECISFKSYLSKLLCVLKVPLASMVP
jgi:hypothetical protein